MVEQLYWRKHPSSLYHPVCNHSEAEWIMYLIRQRKLHSSLYIASGNLVTPNNNIVPAQAIFKYKEICPTGLVINCDNPSLVGALTGTHGQNDRPLRPTRPDVVYDPETKYGAEYYQILADAGFDENEPTVLILMALLRQLKVPVNPRLPEIVASYWTVST